jgi:hypothetical protein
MHRQVLRDEPEGCPISGMPLENPAAEPQGADAELAATSRRFWTSLVLSTPVLLVGMAGMFSHRLAHQATAVHAI